MNLSLAYVYACVARAIVIFGDPDGQTEYHRGFAAAATHIINLLEPALTQDEIDLALAKVKEMVGA